MVRTLSFHLNNVGSIPASPKIKLNFYLRNCSFIKPLNFFKNNLI